MLRVVGDGAVYIVDTTGITYSNVAEAKSENTLSIHDVKVHVLAEGDSFDLQRRRPVLPGRDV